jgi:ComEC/Rec2-related protein
MAIIREKLSPQALVFLCLTLFFLGMLRYVQATDTSSPYHITNFLNRPNREMLILGTVVQDPDRREGFTFLTLKPEEITPYPLAAAYLKLDQEIPHKVLKRRIIGIFDADTLFTCEGETIRLLGVDAPEVGEKGAQEAAAFTRSLTLQRQITLYIQEDYPLDGFGRLLAVVEVDGYLLNSELLERGLARYYSCPHTEILILTSYEDKKKILKGKTGYIRLKVYPTIGEYYEKMSFGDQLEIVSRLSSPRERRNPAGFCYASHLRVRNIYAVTGSIREPQQVSFLGAGTVNPLVRVSLRLRHRIFETIERTVPYPESAFLAAVTLGMRGEISKETREQFTATGVAHVLAISGLHAGFVALLLIGIARLLHLHRTMKFLWVSLGLLIFVFLSGASPATQRAALMFSLGLLLFDVLKVSLLTTAGVTLSLSAVIVLFINPLWLPDTSFVLSYAAVLSLIYLTRPVEQAIMSRGTAMRGFVGAPLIGVLAGMSLFSLPGIIQNLTIVQRVFPAIERIPPLLEWFPPLFYIPGHSWLYQPQFLTATLLLAVAGIALFFIYLKITGNDLMMELSLRRGGRWFLSFCFAQLAIQLGMLWPFSAVYFLRFPIAGFYSNIIAIPLLGLIVILGWIAGLVELFFSAIWLGFLGQGLAAVINWFNTVLCQGFLGLVKTWYDFVPWPYVGAYGAVELIFWYGLIVLFIFHQEIFQKILWVKKNFWLKKKQLAISAMISLFMVAGASAYLYLRKPPLRVVFFDAGLGNVVLVSTPEGKNILIDGGPKREEWSFGRTIRETLSHYRIDYLNYIIVTSLRPGNIGGLVYVIENIPVKRVILPVKEEMLRADLSYEEFLLLIDDWRLLSYPFMPFPQKIYTEYIALIRSLANAPLQIETVRKSNLLFEEKDLKIEALTSNLTRGELDCNFSLVLRVSYKEKVIILPSQVGVAAQRRLAEKYPDKLSGDVMLIPAYGNPKKQTAEFITAVSPVFAINQYGWAPTEEFFPMMEKETTLKKFREKGIITYSTSKQGAVVLTSNGRELFFDSTLE